MRIIKNGYLYQLTLMPTLFPVNCYFIEEEAGLTLIDAALGFAAKGIFQAAEKIGKPIVKIVLTHAHQDHVGALDAIKERFPHIPVYISQRDDRLMNGDRTLDSHEDQTPIKGGVPKNLKTRANELVMEGSKIGSLKVLETPGHTPGSISLIDTRTNAIIAGDAFQVRGGMAVAGDVKPLFPFPAWGTWSKATALKSAKKLAEIQPTLLAVGHGNMIENPRKLMEEAICRLENKLK